ncbi:MAG TPA: SpoIIE family protein phosphatase [Thermaerobacter sp.]
MTRWTGSLERAEQSAQFASFRRLIDKGVAAVEARNAEAAVEYFRAAYDLALQWRLGDDAACGALINLSMAQRLAGDHDAAMRSLARALRFGGTAAAQRAALWNHLGVLYGEREEYRQAAYCCIRAYRLLTALPGGSDLQAEAAANVIDFYLRLGRPQKATRWAARAAWHARRAAPWRRQGAALQVATLCLAMNRTRLAGRILRRLERESLAPDFVSQFLRLQAEWWSRQGERLRALSSAVRALDAAVRDLSPEDIEDACQTLARLQGDEPAPGRARRLAAAARAHQAVIGAFARACEELDLARESRLAALLTGPDGLILLRCGGEEALDRLAVAGLVPGATAAAPGLARAAIPGPPAAPGQGMPPGGDPPTGDDRPGGSTREVAGYVLVWPAQPALARAIACLTAHIHADEQAARLRHEREQALARLSAFHDAALALGGPLETGQVVHRLLALTRQVSRSDGVALVFTDPGRGTWADGLDGAAVRRSPVFRRAAQGRPQRLAVGDPRWRQELDALGVASLLAVPVYFGGTSAGAVLVAARVAGTPFTEEDLELVTFVSKQFGLALENAALRDDLSRRLEAVIRDLRIARRLQEAFMPRGAVRDRGAVLAGLSLPAKYVGGDLYDFTWLPDGCWGLALGDVMGQGVGAAMLGSILLVRLRETWQREPFGPGLVWRLDAVVSPDLQRGRALATLVLGRYDPETRHLRVLTAGHHGPVLWRDGRWHPLARGGGTALGLAAGSGAVVDVPVALRPGDVVLFYSDGFGELVAGRRGAGGAGTVARALMTRRLRPLACDPLALLEQIHGLAARGDHPDDATVVVLGVGANRH